MNALRIPLRIVFYRDENGDWIARCLEFDLCGDGPTKEAAAKMLSQAIDIQLEQSLAAQNPANLFTPSDGEYFRMFAAGQHVLLPELEFSSRISSELIERTESREFAFP